MVLTQRDLITVDGIPAHPLLVHAVVVLLPLAALGGLVIAARAGWRRRFGTPVLLLAIAGVLAVPLAQRTGDQLKAALPANPAVDRHQQLGSTLLPFAIAFGVAVLLLVIAGRLADRERERAAAGVPDVGSGARHDGVPEAGRGARPADPDGRPDADPEADSEADSAADSEADSAAEPGARRAARPGAGRAAATASDARAGRTWRRLAVVAAALVAFTGVAMTVQIVRIGHTGSVAVWQGVGRR